jgi:hypothetical protein
MLPPLRSLPPGSARVAHLKCLQPPLHLPRFLMTCRQCAFAVRTRRRSHEPAWARHPHPAKVVTERCVGSHGPMHRSPSWASMGRGNLDPQSRRRGPSDAGEVVARYALGPTDDWPYDGVGRVWCAPTGLAAWDSSMVGPRRGLQTVRLMGRSGLALEAYTGALLPPRYHARVI